MLAFTPRNPSFRCARAQRLAERVAQHAQVCKVLAIVKQQIVFVFVQSAQTNLCDGYGVAHGVEMHANLDRRPYLSSGFFQIFNGIFANDTMQFVLAGVVAVVYNGAVTDIHGVVV